MKVGFLKFCRSETFLRVAMVFSKGCVYTVVMKFCDDPYGSPSPSIYNSNRLEPRKPPDPLCHGRSALSLVSSKHCSSLSQTR
jgi:hypothetical protein